MYVCVSKLTITIKREKNQTLKSKSMLTSGSNQWTKWLRQDSDFVASCNRSKNWNDEGITFADRHLSLPVTLNAATKTVILSVQFEAGQTAVMYLCTEHGGLFSHSHVTVGQCLWLRAKDRLATRRWPVPSLIHVTGEQWSTDQHVSAVATILYSTLVRFGSVDQSILAILNAGRRSTFQIWSINRMNHS